MDTAFQGIERLWQHEQEALGLIRLPEPLTLTAPEYMLHPALLDACLQVFVAALPGVLSNSEALYLPSGLGSLRIHGEISRRVWSHAQVVSDLNKHQTAFEGDVRIFDEAGNLLVEVDGLRLQQVEAPPTHTAKELDGWLYDIRWQPKPLPAAPVPAQTAGRWIIFADQQGISARLAAQLRQQGESCLLVKRAGTSSDHADGAVEVDPQQPQTIYNLLRDELAANQPLCRGIVHAWSLDATPPEATTSAMLAQAQQDGVVSALHLAQALHALGASTPRLWLVTRNAQPAGSSAALPALAQAPLWGLGRSLPLELPRIWSGLIDLDGDAPDAVAATQLFDAVWRSDHEDQLAFRDGQRLVARLERDQTFRAERHTLTIRPAATYIITGGLGNLGQHYARWIVEHGGRQIVLLGRSGASEAARATLDDLRRSGARIEVVTADVADPAAMAELFNKLASGWPPIRGIIHAAGVTSYQTLENLQAEDLLQMLRPKVFGTWVLHDLCRTLELDFFMCISSLSPVWGSKGLSHYAAANHFLDIFGHYAQRLHLPVTTINLGPIAGGGMATATQQIQQSMDQSGLHLLQPGPALDLSAAVIGAQVAQKIIADVDWTTFRQLHELSRQRPILESVAPNDAVADQQSLAPSALLTRLEQLPAGERAETLTAHIQASVCQVLKLDATRQPDPERGFFDMGMDSLMVLDLRNRLQNSLGTSLPTTLLFEYSTIETLTSYLLDDLFAPVPTVAGIAQPELPRQPDDLADIAALTEDDLKRLIDAELETLIDD